MGNKITMKGLWSCAQMPAVLPLGGLDKKMTPAFQRSVIPDA